VSAWKPDVLLTVVPYYNKPPQRGLVAHFTEIARATNLPILLYNVPGRTVVSLEPKSVSQLSRLANIVGIKDATGDMTVVEELKSVCPKDFILLSGDDETVVEFNARGGHGAIAVASHVIGREMREAMRRARSGEAQVTLEFSKKYERLIQALYREVNPIATKMALYFMGLIDSPEPRLPLVSLDEKYHQELKTCLNELGKI
jgi:4-hydroxy-tetrahydrodipicolinate synthase